ncbi:MAG TPA: crossover junction endodeoxyribonuclease RuvC [Solirubrobacteraceae bacterium]|nr:crossover junction endodeoxyribonuclease RuvC [Solirubrobacteraceae bacterium]
MIVLGIDPGTATTGYGIVERTGSRIRSLDYGCIQTPSDRPLAERLLEIRAAITDLIQTHRPALVAVERLFFNRNVQTAFAVGQARGVVLLAAGQRGLPCTGYTPQQVKGAVCGNGRASKDQVGRMVQALLGLSEQPRPDHAADALAVAICHANCAPLAAALAQATDGADACHGEMTGAGAPARVGAGR